MGVFPAGAGLGLFLVRIFGRETRRRGDPEGRADDRR
jgi:hypothetical protein